LALDAYTRRVLAARRVHLSLDAQALEELNRLLEELGRQLTRGLMSLPEGERQQIARRIVQRAYANLDIRLQRMARDGVRVQFAEIKRIMDDATYQELRRISGTSARVVFQPRPPVDAATAFLARQGTAQTFRTLATAVQGAAAGTEDLVLEALARQWNPEDLARKLRRFVKGQAAFGPEELRDLRKVPFSRREAARKLQYNARRIAITEMGNAAHEAQVQSMIEAPQVEAARWRLSPVRGTQIKPDECDILAFQNLYGMGNGIFPITRIPVRPHPFDRCWLQGVTRPPSKWGQPKPSGNIVNRPTAAGLEELTPPQQARAIQSATRAIRAGIEGDRVRRSETRARSAA